MPKIQRPDIDRSSRLLKALADPTRLRLVQVLLERSCYVEELAERLALSAPTISFHLKKLEQAGLVRGQKQQYYVVYHLRPELLDQKLLDLVATDAPQPAAEEQRLAAYHRKILTTFLPDGRLRKLPAQRKKRLVVLAAFAADFADDGEFTEPEVNATIARRFADYCTVRRELIDARLMSRSNIPGQDLRYRRVGAVEMAPLPLPDAGSNTESENAMPAAREERKRLIELYKQTRKTAGVYGIRNTETGRLLLGSGLNLHGPLQRHRSELTWGSHRCRALQQDWNRLGQDTFVFEVLGTIDPALAGYERDAALRDLEQEWLARLQPLAERCYNSSGQIRTKPY